MLEMISGSLWRQTNGKRAKWLLGMVRSAALCKRFGEVRQQLAARWPTRQKHMCCLAPMKDEGKKGVKILEGSSQAIPGLKKLAGSGWNGFSSGSAAL